MSLQRTLLGLVGLALAGGAAAQGSLRWPNGKATGLQPPELRLNLQAGYMGPSPMERLLSQQQPQGVKLEGRAASLAELGVYGRFGVGGRASLTGNTETSLAYGVGLSWDLSPRASATLGWDSYDFRTGLGVRDVRATSLGLQLRY